MISTLDMYKIAQNENIDILDYNWNKVKARIFEIDNKYYIALDNDKITNSIEEKEILAEYAHFLARNSHFLLVTISVLI